MNGANGMSDMEGKVTRVGASERGQRASFNRDRDLAVDHPGIVNDNRRLIRYVWVCLQLNTGQFSRLNVAELSPRVRLRERSDELPS